MKEQKDWYAETLLAKVNQRQESRQFSPSFHHYHPQVQRRVEIMKIHLLERSMEESGLKA
jgi:hypothetical protein